MRVVLIVEYDGTDYCGWQCQPNGLSVQEVMENCFFEATGEKTVLTASGRTDSGVHALGQVVHFDTALEQPAESFKHVFNAVLPPDIKVRQSFEVAKNFHARYSAKKKTYVYRTYISPIELPLKRRFAAQIFGKIDMDKMLSAKKLIEGTHDFAAFCASGSSAKSTIRTVFSIDIERRGDDIDFYVSGNGFLYNMVRIIVGTLLAVGYGKISESDVANAISFGERKNLGKTMPACGLTLCRVEYSEI
jgi:tRNA pseudouridine38-40 synthase